MCTPVIAADDDFLNSLLPHGSTKITLALTRRGLRIGSYDKSTVTAILAQILRKQW